MKWLITGGCGFLGTSLVSTLVREGRHSIRIVDNLSVGESADLQRVTDFKELSRQNPGRFPENGVQLMVGDVLDEALLNDATAGADIVVHLAANTGVEPSVKDPRKDCIVNVIGTLNCLEAARNNHVKRFIFASSGAPLGETVPPIHEELAPHPVSPYGASKLAGEGYCSAYFRTFGLETVVLRFGNVYGPGSGHKNSVVAKFIKRILNGERLEIYGDGTQTRDFIYIDDLIKAILLSSEKDNIGGEIFQIATSKETSVWEMVDILIKVIERAGIESPDVINTDPRSGDVLRTYSDTRKAETLLTWNSNTNLRAGLGKTVDWFLNMNMK